MHKLRMIALAYAIVMGLCASAWGDVAIDEANFPDATFRSYVSSNFDTDSNSALSDSELAAVTTISVSNMGITSLQGIEHFEILMELSCVGNSLT